MDKNNADLLKLLHLAEETAVLAGHQLREHQQDWAKIEAEEGRDVKVKADKLAESLILEQLQSATPYPILTEETGWHGNSKEETVWIVDPLDGSFNYLQHIPFCCVAIALVTRGEPILGVIYDFNHNEIFSGLIGQGAWVNGDPIAVSNIEEFKLSVLNTGFPSRANYQEALTELMQLGQNFRKVRMLGSAALAMAYVAAGRAEVYQERGTMFWDVAAGCAIVKAAGGACTLTGDIFTSPLHAVATNGKIIL